MLILKLLRTITYRSATGCTALIALVTIGLSGCQAGATVDTSDRGKEAFATCAECHGVSGQGNAAIGAPNIAGMNVHYIERELRKFRSGIRGAQFDDREGMRMRPMALSLSSDEDVTAVATYVASLPPVPHSATLGGDAHAGQARYALCSACHGPAGAGNENLKAPRIAGVDDWYLATELRKFKGGVRGADPRDAEGAMMRPMAATLADDKAIQDVVAYVATLKP